MVNAIAHLNIKPPRLTKERFVAGTAAAVARGRRVPPGNTPPFPQSRPTAARLRLGVSPASRQPISAGATLLDGAGVEGVGEVVGERGGYGGGFVWKC